MLNIPRSKDIPWSKFLEELKCSYGSKNVDVPSSISLASKVLEGWDCGENCLPEYVVNKEDDKWQNELAKLKKTRTAVLKLAILHLLESQTQSLTDDEMWTDFLTEVILHLLMSRSPSIEIKRDSAFPEIEFNRYIGKAITELKETLKDFSFEAEWESKWPPDSLHSQLTNLTSVIVVIWIIAKTNGTPNRKDVRKLLLDDSMARVTVNLASSLPTFYRECVEGKTKLKKYNYRIILYCQNWLGQVLRYKKEESGRLKEFREFNIRRLDSMFLSGEDRKYGLTISHLYFAVLIEQLNRLPSNDENPPYRQGNNTMSEPPPLNFPEELNETVSRGQWECVNVAINSPIGFETYFARKDAPYISDDNPNLTLATDRQVLSRMPVFIIDRSSLQLKASESDHDYCLGSMTFNLTDFVKDDAIFWLDLVAVVRHEGIWRVLNIDYEEQDIENSRWSISIDSDYYDDEWLRRLRSSFSSASWTYQVVKSGIFVACAIDLDL